MKWSVFLGSQYLLRSRHRILSLLIQVTFSSEHWLCLTCAYVDPVPVGQGVFPASSLGMDHHSLPDHQPTFDQLLELLM